MSNLSQFGGAAIKSIQRGTISLANTTGTSGTSTLSPAVVTAKSELRLVGIGSDTASYTPAYIVLTNTTTVTATRAAAGGAIVVSWELTEFY